jgi:hypothetical protein
MAAEHPGDEEIARPPEPGARQSGRRDDRGVANYSGGWSGGSAPALPPASDDPANLRSDDRAAEGAADRTAAGRSGS